MKSKNKIKNTSKSNNYIDNFKSVFLMLNIFCFCIILITCIIVFSFFESHYILVNIFESLFISYIFLGVLLISPILLKEVINKKIILNILKIILFISVFVFSLLMCINYFFSFISYSLDLNSYNKGIYVEVKGTIEEPRFFDTSRVPPYLIEGYINDKKYNFNALSLLDSYYFSHLEGKVIKIYYLEHSNSVIKYEIISNND